MVEDIGINTFSGASVVKLWYTYGQFSKIRGAVGKPILRLVAEILHYPVIIRNIHQNSHSLGSLRQCRISIINSIYMYRLKARGIGVDSVRSGTSAQSAEGQKLILRPKTWPSQHRLRSGTHAANKGL